MIKALIFDFDGTIIDTETAWYITFRDAYKKYGVDLTLEQYSQCLGTSLHSFNPYNYLKTHYNIPIDLDEFRNSVKERHTQMMQTESIRPGILKFLESAKAQGFKIGIASSSERSWIDRFVKLHGIEDYFECFCTADTVKKVKPNPELYLQALKKLNIAPSEALAIEDSPNGARAAVSAGIPTVVIKNTITKQLPFDIGHHTIDSLASFELDELVEHIQQKIALN